MKFVESPFCFNGKLKTCIVDGRITDELEKSLYNIKSAHYILENYYINLQAREGL